MIRLELTDPVITARMSHYRAVIGLRNRLVHEYDRIDNAQVWEIITHFLPILHVEATALLEEAEREISEPDDQQHGQH